MTLHLAHGSVSLAIHFKQINNEKESWNMDSSIHRRPKKGR